MKKDKEVVSINFEKDVVRKLDEYCDKHDISRSAFVNEMMKKKVMNEKKFAMGMANYHSNKADEYKALVKYLNEIEASSTKEKEAERLNNAKDGVDK